MHFAVGAPVVTLEEAKSRYPGAEVFRYGDGPKLCAEVLALIRAGRKTMSCDRWSDTNLPQPGRTDIATTWDGRPAIAVKTLSVEKIRFCDMSEELIPPQGEFRDLAHWRAGYKAYLSRLGDFDEDMNIMIETYEMTEDFGAADV